MQKRKSYFEIAHHPVFPLLANEKSQYSALKRNNVVSHFEMQNFYFYSNIFIFWAFKILPLEVIRIVLHRHSNKLNQVQQNANVSIKSFRWCGASDKEFAVMGQKIYLCLWHKLIITYNILWKQEIISTVFHLKQHHLLN